MFFSLLALGAVSFAQAQDCSKYIYFKDNARIESVVYDGNGKEIRKEVQEISGIEDKGGERIANITTTKSGNEGNSSSKGVVKCNGGNLYFDLTVGLPKQDVNNPAIESNAKTSFLTYPSDPKIGQTLESSLDFNLNGTTKGKSMKVNFKVEDRKVSGKEKVSTPIGSWESFKITYVLNVKFKVVGINIPMKLDITEWFVPGYGIVKSEAYLKGKLTERSVITAIK